MDSPLGIARPWTPPETDTEPSPRCDYFSDSFRKPLQSTSDGGSAWMHRLPAPATMGPRCDTPTEDHHHLTRSKPVSVKSAPAPCTPTKASNIGSANANGALRYPYTPDSSRILQRSITELPSSPVPWHDRPEHSPSPVQHALSSCIAHFENLIHTHQPDEDQMEYIIGQIEAMASYLSAPHAQSRATDEHLFLEPEHGLGISRHERMSTAQSSPQVNQEYVAEVGKYIERVRGYIGDLKMRLDEVKALNGIQGDVIQDLRRQMKSVRQDMRRTLSRQKDHPIAEDNRVDLDGFEEPEKSKSQFGDDDSEPEFGGESWDTLVNDDDDDDDRPSSSSRNIKAAYSKELQRIVDSQLVDRPTPKSRTKIITIIRKPERRSFWASFGEALDSFGDLLHSH